MKIAQKHGCIVVVGGPGSGKTTLLWEFLAILDQQGSWEPLRVGLITARYYPAHPLFAVPLVVLGTYERHEPFAGTDRWSMAAQRSTLDFWHSLPLPSIVLGEGSRIATRPFLENACSCAHITLLELLAPDGITFMRRKRRSNQNEQWVKGQYTKIAHLKEHYQGMFPWIEMSNETPEDLQNILTSLLTLLHQEEGRLCRNQ